MNNNQKYSKTSLLADLNNDKQIYDRLHSFTYTYYNEKLNINFKNYQLLQKLPISTNNQTSKRTLELQYLILIYYY